jgi:hypothetical protein
MKQLHEYETPETDRSTAGITDIMGAYTELTNPKVSRDLERRLTMCRDALKSHRQYLLLEKCYCTVGNEAGDRDICGRCISLDMLDEALAATEPKP